MLLTVGCDNVQGAFNYLIRGDSSPTPISEQPEIPAPEPQLDTVQPEPQADILQPPPTRAVTTNYPLQSQSYSWSDSEGYSADVEIKIGNWIRGTNAELLQGAWDSVGGTGEPSVARVVGVDLTPATTAYAIGTVTVKNTTLGFPLDFGGGFSGHRVTIHPTFSDFNSHQINYGLNRGIVTIDHINNTQRGRWDRSSLINTSIPASDTLGPVPFIVFARDVFSPTNTSGASEILDGRILFVVGGPTFALNNHLSSILSHHLSPPDERWRFSRFQDVDVNFDILDFSIGRTW